MTSQHDPWSGEREPDGAPAHPSHPDFTPAEFPQTGWSATVIDPSGTTWRGAGTPDLPAPHAEPQPISPAPAPLPGAASAGHDTRAHRPGPRLGVTAFSLVTAMALACVTFGYFVGRLMGTAMVQFGTPTFDPTQITQAVPALSDQLSAFVGLGFLASLVGIAGLVMAIRARLTGSAPALSLTAVIVGLCTPMLAFIALLAATEPFIHQIS